MDALSQSAEGDFAGAGDGGIGLDVGPVDRGADDLGVVEGMGIFLAAPGEPAHEVVHGGDIRRRLDRLFGLADAFAHPGEIENLHAHCSIRCCTPARK
jgi:hypothetical protein